MRRSPSAMSASTVSSSIGDEGIAKLRPMRRILILGSTGSIGVQALDVVERSDDLEVVGLAAQTSWEELLEQAKRFGVGRIALADETAAARAAEAWTGGEVLGGAEGLVDLIT